MNDVLQTYQKKVKGFPRLDGREVVHISYKDIVSNGGRVVLGEKRMEEYGHGRQRYKYHATRMSSQQVINEIHTEPEFIPRS